jgi:hypothetical protein
LRPVVVEVEEEPARALDTALPMLAVASPEKSVLEGFISAVVSSNQLYVSRAVRVVGVC